ncbi:Abi family protein [Polaribacter porphyrae]|uniref:CAAX protease n=1 Tax=Polaribacter porphyrae TaxID=1137780 RepID=A0A2S7WR92_9FLAO|nr:Abi family protein [Polaribacter porphyrae]PQJ80127.1 CAAX protease [Polaribacter porphyrae]
MQYNKFKEILSSARMNRYFLACNNNTKKAMTLYRLNLKLSQEFFTIISCFEIALRNKIDKQCISHLGTNWLKDGVQLNGIFDNGNCWQTKKSIDDAIAKLGNSYTHNKLVAELGFGFWRFMFARYQFNATHRIMLRIFPSKPISTPTTQYNQNYVFNELKKINNFRNRIAHHEPICFNQTQPIKSSLYARQHYTIILQLFQWMNIDESDFLYGLDHINKVCDRLDNL